MHGLILRVTLALLLSGFSLSICLSEKTLQSIHQQQQRFLAKQKEYARSARQLDIPPDSPYRFVVEGTDDSYSVVAIPRCENKTGRRTFYLDQTAIVRESWGPAVANADSPELFRLAR